MNAEAEKEEEGKRILSDKQREDYKLHYDRKLKRAGSVLLQIAEKYAPDAELPADVSKARDEARKHKADAEAKLAILNAPTATVEWE